MQGYGGGGGGGGGLPEIQHFVVDGCGPSLFPVSAVGPPELHSSTHKLIHHAPAPLQPHPAAHFPHHFHSGVSITQQMFHPQFHLFHHPPAPAPAPPPPMQIQHLVLDHESGPENSSSPTPIIASAASPPGFLPTAVSFKLPIDENGTDGGGEREVLNHDAVARGGGVHPWQRGEPSMKEPFWRPLDLEIEFVSSNHKQEKEEDLPPTATATATAPPCKLRKQGGDGGCYKLFSELEAIYKPGGVGVSGRNHDGSGSALTCDAPPESAAQPASERRVYQSSDAASTGDEATPPAKKAKTEGTARRRKHRRRQRRNHQRLAAISGFFEKLVKKLMDHQEDLHRKFMEAIHRRDEERAGHEETWRKQEAARARREDAARAHERTVTASREAAIISFLEKVTGQRISLPSTATATVTATAMEVPETEITHVSPGRWPKAEVEALIEVRSRLEARFQEPGMKGPLWEEVSSAMAAMGYGRSAKRCKEKWENINKYFKKTKDSGKQRASSSKTCPYFQQLSHLYSIPPQPQSKANSELLEAIVQHPSINENEGSITGADIAAGKRLMELVGGEQCEEEEDEVESHHHQNGCTDN